MARPPLGLGKAIRVTREGRQWVACCRFRQLNGVTVRVERWGSSKTAATSNLQDEVHGRAGERPAMLSAGSRFADAAEVYLAKIAERREDSTYDTYRHWADTVVLPALGELRIHESDVASSTRAFAATTQPAPEALQLQRWPVHRDVSQRCRILAPWPNPKLCSACRIVTRQLKPIMAPQV